MIVRTLCGRSDPDPNATERNPVQINAFDSRFHRVSCVRWRTLEPASRIMCVFHLLSTVRRSTPQYNVDATAFPIAVRVWPAAGFVDTLLS